MQHRCKVQAAQVWDYSFSLESMYMDNFYCNVLG